MGDFIFKTGLIFLFPLFAHGQNEKSDTTRQSHDTYLTMTATNICFYKFDRGRTYLGETPPKYSYYPSFVLNLSAKIFLTKKLALLLQSGLLDKRYNSEQVIAEQMQSNQIHYTNTINSITALIGLQRQFKKTNKISFFIGTGIASKLDLQYKATSTYTAIYQAGNFYWHQGWSQTTTKGNIGVGLNLNYGIDFKVTSKLSINSCIHFSVYQYFLKPVETTKTTDIDFVTGTTTVTEYIYDPKTYSSYGTGTPRKTGGSNFFGRTDLLALIGLTYKLK